MREGWEDDGREGEPEREEMVTEGRDRGREGRIREG